VCQYEFQAVEAGVSYGNSPRQVHFEVECGKLVRFVTRRGYVHRATLATLREIAWYIEEHAAEGVTTNGLWEALPELSATQIAVALDFLKDRGCVETRGRRNFLASDCLFEDAMIVFHALEHPEWIPTANRLVKRRTP
jgi:hypothetical protein